MRSHNVVGTPYYLEAWFTPISPSYTACMAAPIDLFAHCRSLEGRLLPVLSMDNDLSICCMHILL